MWVLITCTLVTTLYATTITIANVSLPQIQGSMSASPDQIGWVVTSNLIATAVTIPLSGWLSARFGRRRVMLVGVSGFAFATLMCGLSNSLTELVFWRVVQSSCGSPLTPISQSVVIDRFPGEKRGPAIAVYGFGVVLGPTIAPLLGGWISEAISWRWVFFILIPMAGLALAGLFLFLEPEKPKDPKARLDWTGFLSLSIAVGCIQLMLDRGERAEWFSSPEIIIELSLAVLAGWVFLVHSFTTDRPFLDPKLFTERNFALGMGIAVIFGMLFVTPMVLMPAMLQQLRDIPEFTVGTLIAARGLGTMVAQIMMMYAANRWSPRSLLWIGFGAQTVAGLQMAHYEVNVTLFDVAWTSIIQGFGVGCLWTPITLVIFSNFDPRRTAEGASLFHFVRSLGSSYFISASFVVVFHTQKISYSELVRWINPFHEPLRFDWVNGVWSLDSLRGLMSMAGEVGRQSLTIGFVNAYALFLWASILVYPLIMLVAWPARGYVPPRGSSNAA
ncbi:MAG: DHA2 family efflux MFS transporter permease subunit [Gammaproteobacteria bacterium]|nr:DHA2 family efflux MFS transporter permease subunit [Gammaproteobacteria bacterium]